MKIRRGNITLERLEENHIEMVRRWRNSPEVAQFMIYREHIAEEAQKKWFASIDNYSNLYFIIYSNEIPVGLIYGAGLDWEHKTVENAGIFIAEPSFRETDHALQASLLLNDFAFALGFEKIFIKVLNENKVATLYNMKMGYTVYPGHVNHQTQSFVLTREAYFNNVAFLRKITRAGTGFSVFLDNEEIKADGPGQSPELKKVLTVFLRKP